MSKIKTITGEDVKIPTEKRLGKIDSVYFGIGGYQDAMLGLHLTFTSGSWGVSWTESTWDANMIECSEHAKWTEETRSNLYDGIMRKVSDYLNQSKVSRVQDLKGIPVELEFESNTLKSWRILTEVI